ncbi:flavin reductase family protein [Micromonospora sp. NPDC047074]|uniref:flavin reductase family protein n=1 Tax=Micromonospora sp. NPDC047074 TaxID=3154339 RepID=UPI0033C83971
MSIAVARPPRAAVDPARFRAVMAEFPTFVTVVTSAGSGGPVGCTANAVLSLSLDPPSVVVSLASRGHTVVRVLEREMFGINVLTWRQRSLTRRFANGEPCRRFDDVPHHRRNGVPILTDAAASLVCVLERQVPVHDHTLLIGRVIEATTGPDTPALVFHRNTQHPLLQLPEDLR